MVIIQLDGEDLRLYYLVAHLVMDEEVLTYNLKYPFPTSPKHCWFVAVEDGNTLGFIPVKLAEEQAKISNYYIADDDTKVLKRLLRHVIKILSTDYELESVTHLRHTEEFGKCGFSLEYQWTNLVKMKLPKKG